MSGHKEHHAAHSASKGKMRAESSGGKKKTHAEKQTATLPVQTFLDDDVCKACGKKMSEVPGGRVVVGSGSWHKCCWVCADCKGPLPADRVLFNPDNGAPVCVACWHKNHSMECFECKKLFEPSETFTVAYDHRYHKDCFRCSKCKEPISEEDFADHNGNPHHVRCA